MLFSAEISLHFYFYLLQIQSYVKYQNQSTAMRSGTKQEKRQQIANLKNTHMAHRLNMGRLKKDLVARLSKFIELLAVCNNADVDRLLEEYEMQLFV